MIRIALPLLALSILSAPAYAAPACRFVTDSLQRLRCYDEAAAKPPGRTAGPEGASRGFAAYPASAYRGEIRMPDFSGAARKYATFRTRLREGMREGPNFAGSLAVIQFGCGTGCSVVYVGDVRTGAIHEFPLGGEDNSMLDLTYRADSRLVTAQWEGDGRCHRDRFVWTGSGFDAVERRDVGPSAACTSR